MPCVPRAADDIHAARATVHESLLFSSRLRLGTEVDNQTVVAFVNDVSAKAAFAFPYRKRAVELYARRL